MNRNQTTTYGGQTFVSSSEPSLETKDCVGGVLNELKRMSREYTTAFTECRDPETRRLFQSLLNSTLQSQEKVFECMQRQGWYNTSSSAQRQEIDKQIQQYQQAWQKTSSFIQQAMAYKQQHQNQHQQQSQQQQPYQSQAQSQQYQTQYQAQRNQAASRSFSAHF